MAVEAALRAMDFWPCGGVRQQGPLSCEFFIRSPFSGLLL